MSTGTLTALVGLLVAILGALGGGYLVARFRVPPGPAAKQPPPIPPPVKVAAEQEVERVKTARDEAEIEAAELHRIATEADPNERRRLLAEAVNARRNRLLR